MPETGERAMIGARSCFTGDGRCNSYHHAASLGRRRIVVMVDGVELTDGYEVVDIGSGGVYVVFGHPPRRGARIRIGAVEDAPMSAGAERMPPYRRWLLSRHGRRPHIRQHEGEMTAEYVTRAIGYLAAYVEEALDVDTPEPVQGPRPLEESTADLCTCSEGAIGDRYGRSIEDLKRWVSQTLSRAGGFHELAEIIEEEPGRLVFALYSRGACFRIVARAGDGRHQGYLGAQVGGRLPEPGESYLRGNDLSDGALSYRTWQRIVGDMAAWALGPPPGDSRWAPLAPHSATPNT